MLKRSDYIEWITCNHTAAKYNLATSGIPGLSPKDEALLIPRIAVEEPVLSLRASIAHLHAVSVDEVAACNGASQAIWLAYASLARPGDEILVETPTYGPFVQTAAIVGANVTRFVRSRADHFALDPDAVCAALTAKTRVVAVTNLHNPSGARSDESAIRAIAKRLQAQDGFLLIDEVYAPFDRSGDSERIACRTSRHIAPNVVVVSSLSKAFGLGMHRIGWVIGPSDLVERAHVALRASTGDLSASWALFGVCAFAELPSLAARAERTMGSKRARIDAWVVERPGLHWSRPAGGLYGLVTLPGARELRTTLEAGIAEHSVIAVPGSFFDVPDSIRIAWSLPEELLDEALRRLDAVLVDHLRGADSAPPNRALP